MTITKTPLSAAMILISGAMACAPIAAEAARANSRLQGPYETPRVAAVRVPVASDCADAPRATASLSLASPYKSNDKSYSRIDLDSLAKIEAETKAVRDFTGQVVLQANRYAVTKGANAPAGLCALRLLDTWAQARALQDMRTHDAQFRRSLQLAALALAYDQIRDLNPADVSHDRIKAWLRAMAQDTRDHYDALAPTNPVRNNNHIYWAGLAAAATAAATDDQVLLRWAGDVVDHAACAVDKTGALPLEVGRASRARQYHLYSAEPLVMTAEILIRNGGSPYDACKGGLHRLVDFATNAIDRPHQLEVMAGARQEAFFNANGGIPSSRMAWIELYDRRFPGRSAFASRIADYRPYSSIEMGGAVSALLGRR